MTADIRTELEKIEGLLAEAKKRGWLIGTYGQGELVDEALTLLRALLAEPQPASERRHWLAEKKGLVEPLRVIHNEGTANGYRAGGGWNVTGPYVPERGPVLLAEDGPGQDARLARTL